MSSVSIKGRTSVDHGMKREPQVCATIPENVQSLYDFL